MVRKGENMLENHRYKISLLDCTLRDGAHVNGGNFSDGTIRSVVSGLSSSGIDMIEVGFLAPQDRKKGSTFFRHVEEVNQVLEGLHDSVPLALMVRPDQYPVNELGEPSGRVKTLRIAFRKDGFAQALEMASKAKESGFFVHLNPINLPGYSLAEIEALCGAVQTSTADRFSIVDTYGTLSLNSLQILIGQIDLSLNREIGLGLHLHENLSLAHGLAIAAANRVLNHRDLSIDCTLLGMGRDPGNLPTELISHSVNEIFGGSYVLSPILDLVEHEINRFKAVGEWGYNPIYALSAIAGVDRAYAEELQKQKVGLRVAERVFRSLAKKQKNDFDLDDLLTETEPAREAE